MDFKGHILNTLLDKYEKSSHYQGKAKVNRKIALNVNSKSLPWYWKSEQPHLKKAIHEVVKELAHQGIIQYKWMPFEKGNLLDSVWLNLEKIDLAYSAIGRIPKETRVTEVAQQLESLLPRVTQPWIRNFLVDCLTGLKENKDFPSLLPVDQEERELLLKALMGLEDKRDIVLLERVFSLKYLGHSKIFQREVKGRLTRIASKYLLDNPDLTEDEIISELGIEKTSEEVLLWGSISFHYGDKEIDYSFLPFGGVIDTKYIHKMEFCSIKVPKIITIENKANFHYMVNSGLVTGALLVYLGGFPGPQKRIFLEVLYNTNSGNAFYHWGDIDLGGFRIFQTIKKVIPTLEPLFMDEDTLLKYKDYCDVLEDNYASQLKKLLCDNEYEKFWPVINTMLSYKIRLEQEALLVSKQFE